MKITVTPPAETGLDPIDVTIRPDVTIGQVKEAGTVLEYADLDTVPARYTPWVIRALRDWMASGGEPGT